MEVKQLEQSLILKSYHLWKDNGIPVLLALENAETHQSQSHTLRKSNVSWQKLALVMMWQTKFLVNESTTDSTDNLSEAAELTLVVTARWHCWPVDTWLTAHSHILLAGSSNTPLLRVCVEFPPLSGDTPKGFPLSLNKICPQLGMGE